jgi:hypothetical protein
MVMEVGAVDMGGGKMKTTVTGQVIIAAAGDTGVGVVMDMGDGAAEAEAAEGITVATSTTIRAVERRREVARRKENGAHSGKRADK